VTILRADQAGRFQRSPQGWEDSTACVAAADDLLFDHEFLECNVSGFFAAQNASGKFPQAMPESRGLKPSRPARRG
jgi:hypothetical protein